MLSNYSAAAAAAAARHAHPPADSIVENIGEPTRKIVALKLPVSGSP
jgi:hypothetical protein